MSINSHPGNSHDESTPDPLKNSMDVLMTVMLRSSHPYIYCRCEIMVAYNYIIAGLSLSRKLDNIIIRMFGMMVDLYEQTCEGPEIDSRPRNTTASNLAECIVARVHSASFIHTQVDDELVNKADHFDDI